MRQSRVDLARFVAAAAVVFYHYVSRPEATAFRPLSVATDFGYLGVPLFFVISGYVIAFSADNRGPVDFAISRFVRLYPSYWVGMGLTILLTSWLAGTHYPIEQVAANLTMMNNYVGIKSIDGVYWTLHKELQFYACIFLLMATQIYKKTKLWLSIWMLFTITFALWGQPFFMGWFISPSYSSLFIVGIACFLIRRDGPTPYPIIILFLASVVSAYYGYQQALEFVPNPEPMHQMVAAGLTLLMIVLFVRVSSSKRPVSRSTLFISLGALTYPLYLIHNIAGKLLIDEWSGLIGEPLSILLVFALMMLLAWIVHVLVERRAATPLKERLMTLANLSGSRRPSAARP